MLIGDVRDWIGGWFGATSVAIPGLESAIFGVLLILVGAVDAAKVILARSATGVAA
jgi:hypothetical protein